jgi:ATP-dependent Clp protease ATP-binding subunit ClpA
VDYLEDIKDGALKAAIEMKAGRVMPRHILLALLTRKDAGIDLLEQEGIDTDGLNDVLLKYGSEEKGEKKVPGFDASMLRVLARTGELARGYHEEPGPEFLLWALSEEGEFINDELLAAIGIEWGGIGYAMRKRVEARHASHSIWSQALIADPGLHKAGVHKSFSEDMKKLLKMVFEKKRDAGGGKIEIPDLLQALLDDDPDDEIKSVLSGAGFDVEKFHSGYNPAEVELDGFVNQGTVSFANDLIDALCEAREQIKAFPSDLVERHHVLLGLLRVGEKSQPEAFGEFADAPYGPYQHAAIELIHKRRGTPKLDLSDDADPEALKLLTRKQMQELCAIPVKVIDGKLIVGTPGYLSPHILERIRRIVNMPVEARLSPGKWFKEHCGL